MNAFAATLLVLCSTAFFWFGYFVAWPLMFVCVVPICVVFCACTRRRELVFWSVVGGFAIWRPLQDSLGAYGQWGVTLLCLWQAFTLIPVGFVLRAGCRRGWSMTWLLPLAWVGGESLRMLGLLAFPFGALAIPAYEQVWLIQIADLGGLHAVSFLIGAVNGYVLDQLLNRRFVSLQFPHRPISLEGPTGALIGLCLFAAGYGQFRLQQLDKELRPGPRVSVVQPDVPYLEDQVDSYDSMRLLSELKQWSEDAVRKDASELVVWPEGIASFPLMNPEYFEAPFDERLVAAQSHAFPVGDTNIEDYQYQWKRYRAALAEFREGFVQWVGHLGAPVIVGYVSQSPSSPPSKVPFERSNVAQLFQASQGECEAGGRQLKLRLFPGGEYLPFRDNGLVRWLGRFDWVQSYLASVSDLVPGQLRTIFRLNLQDTFAIAICSEILFPESASIFLRRGAVRKPIRFLVNVANEGRFQRNRAQLIPYALLPFRAVEGRLAIARSANTGISGFVDPAGRTHGSISNPNGQVWTGRGMPEKSLIHELIAFRNEHESSFGTDEALAKELNVRIQAIEVKRAEAGISGVSTETLLVTDRVAPYQRLGNWFRNLTVVFLFVAFLGVLGADLIRNRRSIRSFLPNRFEHIRMISPRDR